MKLVRIAQGAWTVYAACSDERTCPLLEFVAGLDNKRAARVMSDLKEFVPNTCPADWARSQFSWQLRASDGILEFRWSTSRGGTPRVLWFFDDRNVVVCSHGLNKKGDALEPREIRVAEVVKARYRQAKGAGQLTVVPLEEFDPPDEEESQNG
jgi:hypothetical protein